MSQERRVMREGATEVQHSLQIEGTTFELVDVQRDGHSAIYKGQDSYLRIGNPAKIVPDLELHRQMEKAGFPVASILSEGEVDGKAYFVESSLGDKHFGALFADDIESTGAISQEHLQNLIDVTDQFARAQLHTQSDDRDFDKFAKGIHLDMLCDELPEYADKISARFEEVRRRVADLPFVLTHGDFNPNNLYPEGVIDLEDSFHGPFGHDLIGGLIHIDYFPDSREYEYFAKYRFSDAHKAHYLRTLDRISEEVGLPPLSNFQEDFEFTRGVWLLVRLHKYPKLQKFRYNKFIEKFLV